MRSMLLFALLWVAQGACYAQDRDWKRLVNDSPDSYFHTQDAARVAGNVLLWQRCTGGWPKNQPVHARLDDAARAKVLADKARRDDSTIDNDATTLELCFLARYYHATASEEALSAFRRGVEWLLEGQYDNGGWPQFWPENRAYQVHITYNDNAMLRVMLLLRALRDGVAPFSGMVDEALRERLSQAFDRGIDCLLRTQIRTTAPTVWCQQHDCRTLLPAKARAYELPSYCSAESVGLVELLMSLPNPGDSVVEAVCGAMDWFERNKIVGCRLELATDSLGRPNRHLVPDDGASPLWARFYDLDACLPFVCDRDGVPRRSLDSIGYERRNGYSWYNDMPSRLFPEYEEWKRVNAWRLEAESDSTTVTWSGDTLTLSSPKGASLWWRQQLAGDVEISYRARVLGTGRVSDLNCFWMASRCGVGTGRFLDQYAMSLYYVGMGGNSNSTTRFRRYTGDVRGVEQQEYRPAILAEYTDPGHLLVPDRWYDITLRCCDGRVQYIVDGEVWVDYIDPQPLRRGWFALRTTWATIQMTAWRVSCLSERVSYGKVVAQ